VDDDHLESEYRDVHPELSKLAISDRQTPVALMVEDTDLSRLGGIPSIDLTEDKADLSARGQNVQELIRSIVQNQKTSNILRKQLKTQTPMAANIFNKK